MEKWIIINICYEENKLWKSVINNNKKTRVTHIKADKFMMKRQTVGQTTGQMDRLIIRIGQTNGQIDEKD